jgi:hypothetical protein
MSLDQSVLVVSIAMPLLGVFIVVALIGGAVWVSRREKARGKVKREFQDVKIKREQDLKNILSFSRWLFFWATLNLFFVVLNLWDEREQFSAIPAVHFFYLGGVVICYYLTAILLWKRTTFVFIPFIVHILLIIGYPFFLSTSVNFWGFFYALVVGSALVGFWKRAAFKHDTESILQAEPMPVE